MKKLLTLICALAISATAMAAPAKTAKAHFNGTIGSYDTATKVLTVKHDGKDSTFQINDKSQVIQGKAKADASSLSASTGQSVKIDYVMDGTMKTAETIEVAPAHMAHAAHK